MKVVCSSCFGEETKWRKRKNGRKFEINVKSNTSQTNQKQNKHKTFKLEFIKLNRTHFGRWKKK